MMESLLTIPLTAGTGIAAVWDLKTQKIPNMITYPMMLFGLVFHGISSGPYGLCHAGAGLVVGTGIFLIPYLLGGMGAGDAKLMGGVGAILGPSGVLVAAVLSMLAGLVYAIILLLVYRNYARSFLGRAWITIKTFFYTRKWIFIAPGTGVKEPILCYALPIAMGTIVTVYLKVSGSNLIQQVLGIRLSF
jgi:prepilin peptidase CpaA